MKTVFIISNLTNYSTIKNLKNERKKISSNGRYSFALSLNREDLPDIEEDIFSIAVTDGSQKEAVSHKPKRGRPVKSVEQTPTNGVSPPQIDQLVKPENTNEVVLSENKLPEKKTIKQSKRQK